MRRRGPFTMYYDEGCPFCIRTVYLFKKIFGLHESVLLPAQSDAVSHEEMREKNSWIVIDAERNHLHGWHAVSVVVKDSRFFWPMGWLMGLSFVEPIGERIYRCVERHRPMLSKLTAFLGDPR